MNGLRYLEDEVTLSFDVSKCTGCRQCTLVCPHGVFQMDGDRAMLVDRGACIECGACARNCGFGAIEVRPGVGCAAGVIAGWFRRSGPACGASDADAGCGGGPSSCQPGRSRRAVSAWRSACTPRRGSAPR